MKTSINVKTDVAFKEHIAAASSNMFCRNKAMQNTILVVERVTQKGTRCLKVGTVCRIWEQKWNVILKSNWKASWVYSSTVTQDRQTKHFHVFSFERPSKGKIIICKGIIYMNFSLGCNI